METIVLKEGKYLETNTNRYLIKNVSTGMYFRGYTLFSKNPTWTDAPLQAKVIKENQYETIVEELTKRTGGDRFVKIRNMFYT